MKTPNRLPYSSGTVESNLSKTNGTRHSNIDKFDKEYFVEKKKIKRLDIVFWIALVALAILDYLININRDLFFLIYIGLLYGFAKLWYKGIENEIKRTDQTVSLLEEEKKREEYNKVGDNKILYRYYSELGDIESKEAQSFKEKHNILGTYYKK